MTAYPVSSDASKAAALTAIGAQAIGRSEVTLYKQILVAVGVSGGVRPPTGLVATPGDAEVLLTWNSAAGVTWSVWRGLSADFDSMTELATGLTEPSYLDETADNGTTYFYRIVASADGEDSLPSAAASATPEAPSAPTVAPVLSGSADPFSFVANLSWTPSDQLDSPGFEYRLDYDVESSGWTEFGTYGPGVTSADPDFTSVGAGLYGFRIVPLNNVGEGPSSNTVSITLPGESDASYLLLNGGGRLLLNSGGALLING